tara:strand:- start:18560 stop:19522 length:963 start_codon:yes stop_codon:yes gene_type:complete
MKNYKVNKNHILILGITGQDGSLLALNYINNNKKVFGYLTRKKKNYKNLKKLKILNKVKLFDGTKNSIENVISKIKCKYIYFLSGTSSVTTADLFKQEAIESNSNLLIKILEFVRKNKLKSIRILNASSSEIFGQNIQRNSEVSVINPSSYQGLAKSISTEIARAYRLQFGIKIFNAILFNHESTLRPKDYVIQKIISKAQDIFLKKTNKILLGNLDISRDWGWAPEYVEIMKKLINFKNPGDFIVATGVNEKLRNVVNFIFSYYNLDFKKYVYVSKKFIRKNEILKISANNTKLVKAINYKPKILVKKIITKMIKKEYQ